MSKIYYDIHGFHDHQNENNSRVEITQQEHDAIFESANSEWAGKYFKIVPGDNGKPIIIEDPDKDKNLAKARVLQLKNMLLSTDWKVMVNAELIQNNLPPKYAGLHEERQAWRDEINQLEEMYDL